MKKIIIIIVFFFSFHSSELHITDQATWMLPFLSPDVHDLTQSHYIGSAYVCRTNDIHHFPLVFSLHCILPWPIFRKERSFCFNCWSKEKMINLKAEVLHNTSGCDLATNMMKTHFLPLCASVFLFVTKEKFKAQQMQGSLSSICTSCI